MFELFVAATMLTMWPAPVCKLPFEVARSEAAARAVAEVAIASAPDGPGDFAPYELELTWFEPQKTWIVFQSPISRVEGVRFLGGDGLGMRIAACDGAVSDIHRQR